MPTPIRPTRAHPRGPLVVGVVAAAAGAALVAGAAVLRRRRARGAAGRLTGRGDPHAHLSRRARVVRLTARRGAHWTATRVRGVGADQARRAALDERYAVRTAEDVARELGHLKGALMKLGQMVSFVADGLPPEAQAALAALQQDVPPMAPSLAEGVVADELGAPVHDLFLDWDPEPVAAASIGQVHRAVLADGRVVAVKVQYPGVGDTITADLADAEWLSGLLAGTLLTGLDPHALVDELRARMADELDYRVEARCQREFADRYRGHPFIHVPDVIPERSAGRVLTSEWVEGWTWAEFEATATPDQRQRAAEVVFRFAQGSVHRDGVFNGDPHPGNYRFHPDGSVTFLDFGLVKRWDHGELERLVPVLDHVLAHDVAGTVRAMERVGFIRADHGLDDAHVFACVSAPYRAYLTDEHTFTPAYTTEALQSVLDLRGPYRDVIRCLNMPPSFVVLDRVVWGVSALLGRLGARNRWRGILEEYRHDGPPVTELGALERAWRTAAER